jgi:glycosyltransferase involved in cell wall biosynthesis
MCCAIIPECITFDAAGVPGLTSWDDTRRQGKSQEVGLLVITRSFPPDPMSGAARIGRFCAYLPRYGFQPHVITAHHSAVRHDEPWVLRISVGESQGLDRIISAMASWTQRWLLPYNDSFPLACLAFRKAWHIVRTSHPVAVFSTSPPPLLHLTALLIKLRHRLPWIADFRDPLLGNPFRSRRWFFPFDRIIEGVTFRYADRLIANTDALAAQWRRRHPRHAHKIHIIWNGFDPAHELPAANHAERSYRVLAHIGSLYGARNPGRLLASLLRLIARNDVQPERLRVRLIGRVDEGLVERHRREVDALAPYRSLEWDTRLVTPAEATAAAVGADYLLLLDITEGNSSLQVPAKLFEYIRIGRPILAFTRTDSPVHRILQQSGILFRAIPPDAEDLEADQTLLEFLSLSPERRSPSEWFCKNFDGSEQTRVLAGLIDQSGRHFNCQNPR